MQSTQWPWWCWVRVFVLQCSKLGRVIALCVEGLTTLDWSSKCFGRPWREHCSGEMGGKICKFSSAFDKNCPLGFGLGWWVCQVVQGAFCISPLGSAERKRCLRSKFGELGGKCRWRAPALLTAFPGIHNAVAHHASASCCAKPKHLCFLPRHEMKGSKVESVKSRKLGLPSLLQFARVYGTLCAISS